MKTNLILRATAALQLLLHTVNYGQAYDLVSSANFYFFLQMADNQRGYLTSYNSDSNQQLVPVRLKLK